MLDGKGWSLQALSAEYGAKAVFRVQHRGAMVRVEGWDGTRRCLLQREQSGKNYMMRETAGVSKDVTEKRVQVRRVGIAPPGGAEPVLALSPERFVVEKTPG